MYDIKPLGYVYVDNRNDLCIKFVDFLFEVVDIIRIVVLV